MSDLDDINFGWETGLIFRDFELNCVFGACTVWMVGT